MLAVIGRMVQAPASARLFEALRREEVNRGMTFEYCLLTAGTSLNRAPSDQRWEQGDIISLNSGGNYHGYIGDLCRMAIQGEPDAELEDLLGEIETIQRSAMAPIKAGAMGAVIYEASNAAGARIQEPNHLHFLAHGMGLVSHEAPRLAPRGSMAYDPYDADQPLETGMVISVETTLHHPRRGFIKLEDTVAVTDAGFEIYGEGPAAGTGADGGFCLRRQRQASAEPVELVGQPGAAEEAVFGLDHGTIGGIADEARIAAGQIKGPARIELDGGRGADADVLEAGGRIELRQSATEAADWAALTPK